MVYWPAVTVSHWPAERGQIRRFVHEVRDIPQCWEVSTDWRFATFSTGVEETNGTRRRTAVNFLENMASMFNAVRIFCRSTLSFIKYRESPRFNPWFSPAQYQLNVDCWNLNYPIGELPQVVRIIEPLLIVFAHPTGRYYNMSSYKGHLGSCVHHMCFSHTMLEKLALGDLPHELK